MKKCEKGQVQLSSAQPSNYHPLVVTLQRVVSPSQGSASSQPAIHQQVFTCYLKCSRTGIQTSVAQELVYFERWNVEGRGVWSSFPGGEIGRDSTKRQRTIFPFVLNSF